MHKLGDERQDGYIFLGYKKHSNGSIYEMWTSRDKFLNRFGSDFFERREARLVKRKAREESKAKWHKHMDYLASLSDEERAERDAKLQEEYLKKRMETHRDYHRQKDREYVERHKNDEKFLLRRKQARDKYYLKNNAEKIARAEEVRKQCEIDKEAKRLAVEKRKAEMAEKKAAAELAKSLRPPRVLLTDEQRKDRRRDEKRNYKHRRRAIIRGLEVKATPKEIREARAKAKGVCYYCSGKFSSLTLDHVIPIARGGGHTLDNIVFACHACNSAKRDLPAHEFAGQFGMLIV